jgi:hypothetical protein
MKYSIVTFLAKDYQIILPDFIVDLLDDKIKKIVLPLPDGVIFMEYNSPFDNHLYIDLLS